MNAGLSQTLSVLFTPTNPTRFKSITATTTINVLPAPLTLSVNPATRAYGQANPTFEITVSGILTGQGVSSPSGVPALDTTAVPGSNVGTYAVNASGLSSPNYVITYVPGVLTVAPATLTFTAANKVKKVKAANPKLTFIESGLALGQSAKKIFKGAPALSTTATKKSPIGHYPIFIKRGTLQFINKNYTFTLVGGMVKVIGNASK